MPFNVNFYTFSKKQRSTAVPSGTGLTVSCRANRTLDILAPEIVLDWRQESGLPTVYNYARISDFGRWYWITGWKNDGGIWSATLRVDPLASWKTQIGANSCYVYRSSRSYDLKLRDDAYPMKADPRRLTVTLPKVWTIGGANESGAASGTLTVVAGILGSTSTTYYAFTWENWRRFYTKLFSQDYYNDVLGAFGAAEYPEAKTVINPMQYISSAVVIPLGIGYGLNLRYAIDYLNTVSAIPVGPITVTPSNFTAYRLKDDQDQWTYTITLGSDFWHPQADDRGDWLTDGPSTEYVFYFPPLGEIPLDASLIDGANSISYTVYPDYKANTALLDIKSIFTQPSREYPLYRLEFALGTGIQLSNVMTPGTWAPGADWILSQPDNKLLALGIKTAQNLPVISGVVNNGISDAISGRTPHVTSSGKFGSTASMGGQPRLIVTHWLYAADDLDGKGRPLCQIRTLNTLNGFITAEADEIHVGCTEEELTEIREAVGSGFYYD